MILVNTYNTTSSESVKHKQTIHEDLHDEVYCYQCRFAHNTNPILQNYLFQTWDHSWCNASMSHRHCHWEGLKMEFFRRGDFSIIWFFLPMKYFKYFLFKIKPMFFSLEFTSPKNEYYSSLALIFKLEGQGDKGFYTKKFILIWTLPLAGLKVKLR